MMRILLRLLAGVCLLLVSATACMLAWLHWRPLPAWDMPLDVAGWRLHLDGSQLVRLGTHPWSIRVLSGRSFATRYGRLAFLREDSGLLIRCAPCSLRSRQFPDAAIHLAHADLHILRTADALHGTLASGAVRIPWQGILNTWGIRLWGELPATPAQDVYAVFRMDAPEADRARIAGSIGGRFAYSLPEGNWEVEPSIHIQRVSGLGTEALRGLQPQPACARNPQRGFGSLIGKAVIAAEDQRFASHLGYDPEELAAALSPSAHQGNTLRGASTLDEQLARMLFTGAQRSPIRKLRELLYAVEMDRTLGKAQIMRLYLALAPWGDGVCGAEAAAQHYFGKPSSQLAAGEAAWLASLLRKPDLAHSAPETVRHHALWVLKGMQGIGTRNRSQAAYLLQNPAMASLPGS
jgi:monofunctional glycosyltransferase